MVVPPIPVVTVLPPVDAVVPDVVDARGDARLLRVVGVVETSFDSVACAPAPVAWLAELVPWAATPAWLTTSGGELYCVTCVASEDPAA